LYANITLLHILGTSSPDSPTGPLLLGSTGDFRLPDRLAGPPTYRTPSTLKSLVRLRLSEFPPKRIPQFKPLIEFQIFLDCVYAKNIV